MPAKHIGIDRVEFLSVVCPAIAGGSAQGLADAVTKRWTQRELCRFLRDTDVDARRAAALTLGLVGDRTCTGCLARALHDEDDLVAQMAEHGLWSIWFRSGTCAAAAAFADGVALLEQDAYGVAVLRFQEAIKADSCFAEAHHQCGMARFLLGQWREAIKDCMRALQRMPAHFGAMATMGHCYTQLGEVEDALDCYRRALAIHPRMPGVQEAVDGLEQTMREREMLTGERMAW